MPKTKVARQLQLSRVLVSTYFLYSGASVTMWSVHIPYFVKTLDINTIQVSAIIFLMGCGALVSTQLLGRVADKYGSKLVLMGSVLANFAVFCALGFADSYFFLIALAVFMGAAIGTMDFSMNAQAVDIENEYGRAIFSAFHGFWSLGGLVGATIAGFALGIEVPITVTFVAWAFLALPLLLTSNKLLMQDKKAEATAHLSKDEKKAQAKADNAANRPFLKFIVLLGLMSGFGALIEGLGIDWSALYLNRDLGETLSFSAISVAVFSGSMASFRFVADKVLEKVGRIRLIRYEAIAATLGIAIAVLMPTGATSLIGWLIAGIGVSSIVPQLFALAANIGSESHSARNMAKVFGFTYAVMLGGPALIGWLAAVLGLRNAIGLGVVLGLSIWFATRVLGNPQLSKSQKVG